MLRQYELKKLRKTEEGSNEEEKRIKSIFENDEHQGMDEKTIQAHINATKIKNITRIVLGDNMSPTWYYSPYPEPYHNVETLYICDFCLGYFACTFTPHHIHRPRRTSKAFFQV